MKKTMSVRQARKVFAATKPHRSATTVSYKSPWDVFTQIGIRRMDGDE